MIKIDFDPSVISYEVLLDVFGIRMTDDINRQENDTGTQYRSIILYTSP